MPLPSAQPLKLSELWPAPPATAAHWVQEWGDKLCVTGAAPETCLTRWAAGTPLDVAATDPAAHTYQQVTGVYRYLRAAPVLSSGWTLLGELSKVVAVSPQRLVLAQASTHRSRHPGQARARGRASRRGNSQAAGSPDARPAARGPAFGFIDYGAELGKGVGGAELAFEVVGAPGELVELCVITPAQKVLRFAVSLSASGTGRVECSGDACDIG